MIEIILGMLAVGCILATFAIYARQINQVVQYQASRNAPNQSAIDMHSFSIVICVKGDAPYFSKYLEKILTQQYDSFEVIVVYNQIPDALLHFLDTFTLKYKQLVLIKLDESIHPYTQKKQALHLGITSAKYEWIVTTDDDCYPAADSWLRSISNTIQSVNADIVLALSPFISENSWLNRWIRYDALQGAWNMIFQTISGNPFMGIGRNMAFKKELWNASYLETYAHLGPGDDSTLVQFYHEKNIAIAFDATVFSKSKKSLKDWFIQKNRHISTGSSMKFADIMRLTITPCIAILFWFDIWLWMSYFAMSLITLGIVLVYCVTKMLLLYRIESLLGIKRKTSYYLPFFDAVHNFYILAAPLLRIFMSVKWN
jgi:glycosyltransferase involved in cell wall biosynthesis